MTNIATRHLMLSIFFMLLFGCANNESPAPQSPQKFAEKLVTYLYTLDADGIKNMLSEKCTDFPLYSFRVKRKKIIEESSKINVSFNDIKSHDFSKINCRQTKDNNKIITFFCKGEYWMDKEQIPKINVWYWINIKDLKGKPYGKILKMINKKVFVIKLCTINDDNPEILNESFLINRELIGNEFSYGEKLSYGMVMEL